VKQCKIAVNSVINCSFLYYICCFSKQFQAKNKKNTETGHVTSSSKSSFNSPQAITYLLAIRWNEASYLQPFSRYWPLSVLGSWPWPFRVTWRHRSRNHLIPRFLFPIGAPLSPSRYLKPFLR